MATNRQQWQEEEEEKGHRSRSTEPTIKMDKLGALVKCVATISIHKTQPCARTHISVSVCMRVCSLIVQVRILYVRIVSSVRNNCWLRRSVIVV